MLTLRSLAMRRTLTSGHCEELHCCATRKFTSLHFTMFYYLLIKLQAVISAVCYSSAGVLAAMCIAMLLRRSPYCSICRELHLH
jgi:hypothetical protein